MNYDLTILEEGCKEYGIQLNEEQKSSLCSIMSFWLSGIR